MIGEMGKENPLRDGSIDVTRLINSATLSPRKVVIELYKLIIDLTPSINNKHDHCRVAMVIL